MKLGIGEQIVLSGIFSYILFHSLPFFLAGAINFASILAYVFYLHYDKTYWKRQGVVGPEANPFLGNLREFNEGMHTFDMKLKAKYGPTFGTYLLGKPDLVSSDLEILRRVLVRDFNHFEDRNNFLKVNPKDDYSLQLNALTAKSSEDWKRIRNTITPAFTTGKIKRLVPLFGRCAKDLCDYLDNFAKNGQDIPLKDTMGRLTMSVVGRSAFAVDVDTFQKEETDFLKYSSKVFSVSITHPTIILTILFPNVADFFRTYTGHQILNHDVQVFFYDMLEKMLEERRKDKDAAQKYQDFFQLLINAIDEENGQENQANGEDSDIIHEEILKGKKKGISKIELLAQAFIVMIAGYETTAFTLQMIVYIISKMPEIQEKMRDEIMEVIGEKEEIGYEDISKLKYINQVVQETLRMYPPAARTGRVCTNPITINGIHFDKDVAFSVPIYAIHHDEHHYPDPYKFDPERFTPEEKANRDPLTYLPFGYGPRNCIGMRFAYFEIWMTLAHLLKNYRFYSIPGSPDLPIKMDTRGISKPIETLFVKAERILYD